MAENLFKNHSISDIEACIAKALTELLGKEVQAGISELKLSGDTLGLGYSAAFGVSAHVKGEWLPGDQF